MADKPPEIKEGIGSSPLDYLLFAVPPVGLAHALVKEQGRINSIQEYKRWQEQREQQRIAEANAAIFHQVFGLPLEAAYRSQGVNPPASATIPDEVELGGETRQVARTPQQEMARGNFPPGMDVTGMSYSPEKGGFTNITFGRRQEAIDNQFFSAYNRTLQTITRDKPNLAEGEARHIAFNRVFEQIGQLPSASTWEKIDPNWQTARKEAYYRIQNSLVNSDKFRQAISAAIPGLSGQALENLINRTAHIMSKAELNGYAPETVEQEFVKSAFGERKLEGISAILAEQRIDPATATAAEIGRASQIAREREVEQAGRTEASKIGARYAMEASKPISAEDRGKYGIGTAFKTYADMANAGFRFPTETDRKDYTDIADVLGILDTLVDPLTAKVFASGNDYASRAAQGAAIQHGMAVGNELGIAAQQYNAQMGIIGRKMLSMVERGGRFTNQDMEQILKALPQVNFIMPTGGELAKRQLEAARVLLGRKLAEYEGVAIKPMGQPEPKGEAPKRLEGESIEDYLKRIGGQK